MRCHLIIVPTHTQYNIQAFFLQILKYILDNPHPKLEYPPLIEFNIKSTSSDQPKTYVQFDVLGLSGEHRYTLSVDIKNPGEPLIVDESCTIGSSFTRTLL